jgi:signal peptidase I
MRNAALGALAAIVVIALVLGAYELGKHETHNTVGQTETFTVPSEAMEPTIKVGSTIDVSTNTYVGSNPSVGDIVVFAAPPQEQTACLASGSGPSVMRIVATPGQTIYSNGNAIYVDGAVLNQPWSHTALLGPAIAHQTVAANSYFVMGDDRPISCDSRVWGAVPRDDIVGKVVSINP